MFAQVMDFLSVDVAGYRLWQIIVFFSVVLISLVAGRMLRFFMERAAERASGAGREMMALFLRTLAKPAVLLVFTVGFWFGLVVLAPGGELGKLAGKVSRIMYVAATGYAIYRLIDVVDHYLVRLTKRSDSRVDDMLVPLVGKSIRITILVLVTVQIFQALSDQPVTAVLASLGVGGLAVALAGQDTIKNFFGSLVILADKPFEIGDRIVVDGNDGPVEHVGFRSTKIRTLEGYLVTVPNAEMVNKTVQNIGKRPFILRDANLTITYDTPPEKVARAVEIIKEILREHKEALDPVYPPRVYFSNFNDWALNIHMMYWFRPPDRYKCYEFNEKVNFEILKRFNKEGINFAFPSQTLYVSGMTGANPR